MHKSNPERSGAPQKISHPPAGFMGMSDAQGHKPDRQSDC